MGSKKIISKTNQIKSTKKTEQEESNNLEETLINAGKNVGHSGHGLTANEAADIQQAAQIVKQVNKSFS
jgi:hypothetical protein